MSDWSESGDNIFYNGKSDSTAIIVSIATPHSQGFVCGRWQPVNQSLILTGF